MGGFTNVDERLRVVYISQFDIGAQNTFLSRTNYGSRGQ